MGRATPASAPGRALALTAAGFDGFCSALLSPRSSRASPAPPGSRSFPRLHSQGLAALNHFTAWRSEQFCAHLTLLTQHKMDPKKVKNVSSGAVNVYLSPCWEEAAGRMLRV